MNQSKKICPFLMASERILVGCLGESCAWFAGGSCAVAIIARSATPEVALECINKADQLKQPHEEES